MAAIICSVKVLPFLNVLWALQAWTAARQLCTGANVAQSRNRNISQAVLQAPRHNSLPRNPGPCRALGAIYALMCILSSYCFPPQPTPHEAQCR